MARKKARESEALLHKLETRITDKKYQELKGILAKNANKNMSSLLRDILHNRRVKIFTRDTTLDNLMEELAKLRTEIRSIGVNINQMTKLFNTYPEPKKKEFYAKIAFQQYMDIESKIDSLLAIIAKLAKKWLSD